LTIYSFQRDFGIIAKPIINQATGAVITPSNAADISGNIIALLNAGGFFGAIIPSFTTKYIGRRHTLVIAGLFFMIGGILQTAAQNLGMIYAGRIVAGFGLGMISQTSIIFVAECSPKHLRGILMSAFELFLVTGGMLAYWTTYGCSVNLAPTKAQWQVPLSLQVVLAVMVMASALMCQESPRWLAKQGKWEESAKALASLRGAKQDDNEILEEMAEIKAQIDEEIAATKGRSFKEMGQPKNLQRLFWGLGLVFWFIWGGHNAILYCEFCSTGYTAPY
jgi:MFS family permease